jgi:hypothetical protein
MRKIHHMRGLKTLGIIDLTREQCNKAATVLSLYDFAINKSDLNTTFAINRGFEYD